MQKAYIEKVFSNIGIENSYKVAILYNPRTAEKAVSRTSPAYDKNFVKNYASAIGQVIYPACITRVDGCFAANLWARFISNPSKDHQIGIKRVLRYYHGTTNKGIRYSRSKEVNLHEFCDSDFAGNQEKAKSTNG